MDGINNTDMGITVERFISTAVADDYYLVNISKEIEPDTIGKYGYLRCEKLFFGYSDQIPKELLQLTIHRVYIDWADKAIGIDLVI